MEQSIRATEKHVSNLQFLFPSDSPQPSPPCSCLLPSLSPSLVNGLRHIGHGAFLFCGRKFGIGDHNRERDVTAFGRKGDETNIATGTEVYARSRLMRIRGGRLTNRCSWPLRSRSTPAHTVNYWEPLSWNKVPVCILQLFNSPVGLVVNQNVFPLGVL